MGSNDYVFIWGGYRRGSPLLKLLRSMLEGDLELVELSIRRSEVGISDIRDYIAEELRSVLRDFYTGVSEESIDIIANEVASTIDYIIASKGVEGDVREAIEEKLGSKDDRGYNAIASTVITLLKAGNKGYIGINDEDLTPIIKEVFNKVLKIITKTKEY